MNKIIAFMIMSIFVFGMISAQEQEIATAEDVAEAGVTPDSPFYGIELAFEKIVELFNKNSKLSHATERLAEVKVMLSEDKLSHAQTAANKFYGIYSDMENKSQVEEQKKLIDNLGLKISEIASGDGKLTDEDRTEIKGLIEEHKESISNERMGIRNKTNENKGY